MRQYVASFFLPLALFSLHYKNRFIFRLHIVKQVNDITPNEKHKEINIRKNSYTRKLWVLKKKKKIFRDISQWWIFTLSFHKKRVLKYMKNKTKNFDSVLYDTRLWKIHLYLSHIHFHFIRKGNIFSQERYFSKKFWTKILWILFLLFIFFVWNTLLVKKLLSVNYSQILSLEKEKDISTLQENLESIKKRFFITKILFLPLFTIPSQNIHDWYYAMEVWIKMTKLLEKNTQLFYKIRSSYRDKWWRTYILFSE